MVISTTCSRDSENRKQQKKMKMQNVNSRIQHLDVASLCICFACVCAFSWSLTRILICLVFSEGWPGRFSWFVCIFWGLVFLLHFPSAFVLRFLCIFSRFRISRISCIYYTKLAWLILSKSRMYRQCTNKYKAKIVK